MRRTRNVAGSIDPQVAMIDPNSSEIAPRSGYEPLFCALVFTHKAEKNFHSAGRLTPSIRYPENIVEDASIPSWVFIGVIGESSEVTQHPNGPNLVSIRNGVKPVKYHLSVLIFCISTNLVTVRGIEEHAFGISFV